MRVDCGNENPLALNLTSGMPLLTRSFSMSMPHKLKLTGYICFTLQAPHGFCRGHEKQIFDVAKKNIENEKERKSLEA